MCGRPPSVDDEVSEDDESPSYLAGGVGLEPTTLGLKEARRRKK